MIFKVLFTCLKSSFFLYKYNFITIYSRAVIVTAINDARLEIIVKQKIEAKMSMGSANWIIFFCLNCNRNNAKGILMAMEKAVIFRLAVTPFKLPPLTTPVLSNITKAWSKTAYTSTANMKIKTHEKSLSLSLKF